MELNQIKGIGESTIKVLTGLGIEDAEQLICYYPYRYNIIKKSKELIDGENVVVTGICENVPSVYYISKKLNKMTFRINTGLLVPKVTIFNRAFLKSSISVGTELIVIGKYSQKDNSITASDIRLGKLERTIVEPVYHTNLKITSKKINKLIMSTISYCSVLDYIPAVYNEKYNFPDKMTAISCIHAPNDLSLLKASIQKLKYEELFIFMFKINLLKSTAKSGGVKKDIPYDKVINLINNLPFTLTDDQRKSVNHIYNDLKSDKKMNRLLQGDVGSGKTIVSFISLYMNFLAGYQGTLMAPTEVLAQQHFQNIKQILSSLEIALLTGQTKAKEKSVILSKVQSGEIDILIGTHALLGDNVQFKNLGLVVTDEQHRFGVNQRSNLNNKGFRPDILYMSATPIPRTYALTIYGDMDISNIRTMPNGRKPVKTFIKSTSDITEVLYMMLNELKNKHQLYVISPLALESENSNLEDIKTLEEKMTKAFGKVATIGTLHGKMRPKEKDEVMKKFKNNDIQILISTTVIEVGVDVPNATMIVIFDSYMFGLSTLHQLRGRVGRNSLDSYCILISDRETKRLKILEGTNDGFKISEEDFKLRGSGDLFGERQSGDMQFKLADIKRDYNILVRAKEDAEEFASTSLDTTEYKNIYNLYKQGKLD